MACTVSSEWIKDLPFKDFFNSPYVVQLRKDLASGVKSPNCSVCWNFEEKGITSLRKDQLKHFFDTEGDLGTYLLLEESEAIGHILKSPEKLDFRLGTTCNLKCRMCNSNNSSKIWSEYQDNLGSLSRFAETIAGEGSEYYSSKQEPATLQDLMSISFGLSRIGISGGEPNLSKLLLDYLEELVKQGLSQNISLKINTNGVTTSPRMLKAFPHFRRVEIMLSIDGTGRVQEYIRHPSKWSQIEENVRMLKGFFREYRSDQYRILASPTYQALNILNLTDIITWCEQIGIEWSLFHKIITPDFLSVDVLPENVKSIAAQRLENFLLARAIHDRGRHDIEVIIHHLRQKKEVDKIRLKQFFEYNEALDEIRRETMATGCQELYELLQSYRAALTDFGESHDPEP
jgi:pyruvate-formate lyase-activating enzyme